MTRILFVCLGNICRSPLAEAIFKSKIKEKGLEGIFFADSCGTADYHVGIPPDPRTIKNALKNNVTIRHLGRQFQIDDFEKFDLILPMDSSNRSNLLSLKPSVEDAGKIKLMRTFDTLDRNADVPDPYYGEEQDFQHVFEILDRSVENLIATLQNRVTNFA